MGAMLSKVDVLRGEPLPLAKSSRIPIVYSTERQDEREKEAIAANADRARRTAERWATVGQVANQPHRHGDTSWRAALPLWRFCKATWVNDEDHREIMFLAGMRFDRMIRDELVARGLPYIGAAPGGKTFDGEEMTKEEFEAARENIAVLTRNVKEAEAAMRPVHSSAARIMRRVCYEQEVPGPYEEGVLGNALYRLADHLGMIDHGINSLD